MSDVQSTFLDICLALQLGEAAVVEVTAHDDGRWTVDFGVPCLPLLTTQPEHARAWAARFEAEGVPSGVASMLITAAEFCEREGASVH